MGDVRSSLFTGDDDVLDIKAFQPKKPKRQDETVTKSAAAKAGFTSREPKNPPAVAVPVPRPPQRRHRTGRNAQFNLKAKPETITAFCEIADSQGWVLGEALEKAVELMAREFGKKKS
jgi:hypothetical protein